ncbi:SUMF1/EgtB/PvdO family nonheme iron enzyme [Acaryochloris marina]|uniref:Sulfatase-modifying factor enzyme domain-containing protein n=1 Tax=Acaryochloris marina (strain MBIC 11017) TaxID=329726 RepID=B0CG84_ACAM1|nr:SUMF1/EgtB/PvdO family nonheme iron enzyme [Acaryochloris marina]ABW30637.1 conserved hypothetical protein [Acaryochloris marina MBIC11017]
MPSKELFSGTEPLQLEIKDTLTQSRARTLQLFEGVSEETFRLQANSDFSPVGWHLGHIGFTEGLWLLEHEAGYAPLFPEYRRLFAADGLPKAERQNLPSFAEICAYLEQIRNQVWDYLLEAPLDTRAWLWHWLVQHESQHCETITWVLQLHRRQSQPVSFVAKEKPWPAALVSTSKEKPTLPDHQDMVPIEGGQFLLGNDGLEALDNERKAHWVQVDSFWIDRFPVTQGQYQQFIEAGGYRQSQFWSDEGWQWLQENPVNHPTHWLAEGGADHPVCGVSWYEADAYARFVGKRLPTEAEWEKAACWQPRPQDPPTKRIYPWGNQTPDNHHCNHGGLHWGTTPVHQYANGQSAFGCFDLLGNVWEWTNTWFHPFPDFDPYPYKGYSMVYFDHQHRILKGGSWATQAPVLRGAFRNWYEPRIRIHFAGFRCAYG